MTNNLFIKIDIHALRSGMIAELGFDNFAILTAIGTFADDKGVAYPSQETIAKMLGYTRTTVNKKIKALTMMEWDGQPVLVIKKRKATGGNSNEYHINPKVGISFGKQQPSTAVFINDNAATNVNVNVRNEDDECVQTNNNNVSQGTHEQEPKNKTQEEEPIKDLKDYRFANARDVILCFADMYKQRYGIPYQINWGREMKLVKTKLVEVYSEEQIKDIIAIVMSDYEQRWANPKYPRPSLGQLCSWLGGEAMNIAATRFERVKTIKKQQEAAEMSDDAFDAIMRNL